MTLDTARLNGLRLFSTGSFRSERVGERRGRAVGGQMEFADYRPYALGDDLRRVDWNVAARTDRLFIKERHREIGLPVHLLLDTSRSMSVGEPSPFDAARVIARGLAYIALAHGDIVSVAGFGSGMEPPIRVMGKGGLMRIDDALSRLAVSETGDFDRSLAGYSASHRQGGVAIVLSDLLDAKGFGGGIRHLDAGGFEVAVVHLVSPQLLNPQLPQDTEIADAETGESRDIVWNDDARAAYRVRVAAFLGTAEAWCARQHVRYARHQTDMPLTDVFLKEFRRARILE